ncbi:MAG: hypothetical protein ACYDA9_01875 [Terriglobia bacterium]
MSTSRFQSLLLRFAVVSGMAISLMQCSQPQVVKPPLSSNPFPCRSPRTVHVKTQIDTPGANPEFVVLCQNDAIIWDKDPGTHVDHFSVNFKSGTPLKGNDGNPKSTFSDNSNDSNGTAGDAGLSDTQTYAYYKYSIDVVGDDANHTHHPYDPGVIIVK